MGSEKWPYLPGKTSFHTPLTDVCICVLKEHSIFYENRLILQLPKR